MGEHEAGDRTPPGVARPRRFRPRFHYELLVCGIRGHALIGTDATELREEDGLVARDEDGIRWYRCLRCDSWLALPPPRDASRRHPPGRREIELPLRGRPLRDKIILRAIAIDRAFHFVVLGAIAIAVLLLANNEAALRGLFYRVLNDLQGGVGGATEAPHSGFLGEVDKILSLRSGTLQLIAAAFAAYAVLEGVEAVGLWYQKRWAEYLTFIATTLLLPLEVYELTQTVSPLKVIALVVNLAIVIYLLYAKRLFGVRGGPDEEDELRRRDTGWESLEATSPEAIAAER